MFLINSLKNSIKEKSENHMIVDLVRNDLSRIAKKGTVKVTELSKINTYKNIHQMVSTIEAQIENDVFFSKILKSTFPMGSMTGAPKIKTMIKKEDKTKNKPLFFTVFLLIIKIKKKNTGPNVVENCFKFKGKKTFKIGIEPLVKKL